MKRIPTTKADETPEFVEFWEKVWRKHMRKNDGRGDARDAFMQHVQAGADPQDIVDGAKWFVANLRTPRDFEFIPLAASWLNKRAYEDGAGMYRDMIQRMQDRHVEASSNVTTLPKRKTAFLEAFERGEFNQQKAGE